MGPTANESGPLGVLEHLMANTDPLIGEGIPLAGSKGRLAGHYANQWTKYSAM